MDLQTKLGPKGFQLVAINANDAEGYPEDGFEAMVQRAKEKGFNFPYLRDETQEVARSFGAVRTPHVFLFDGARKLAYVGRIDDSWDKPEKVGTGAIRAAGCRLWLATPSANRWITPLVTVNNTIPLTRD